MRNLNKTKKLILKIYNKFREKKNETTTATNPPKQRNMKQQFNKTTTCE